METPFNQSFFNAIASDFDTHVRQSIPLFGPFISNLRANLAALVPQNGSILDICGSTGKLGYDLIVENGFDGRYYNLDGSPDMIRICNQFSLATEKYEGTIVPMLGGFMASWEDESGIHIPEIDPLQWKLNTSMKFDVALEILGFQFFTKDREPQIKEMKRLANTCVFVEKFSTHNETVWERNERLKDTLWKSKFFTQDEIKEKKEKVLDNMGDYLYDDYDFEVLLRDNFMKVETIFHVGNFRGYIASNDHKFVRSYMHQHNLIFNEYNSLKWK